MMSLEDIYFCFVREFLIVSCIYSYCLMNNTQLWALFTDSDTKVQSLIGLTSSPLVMFTFSDNTGLNWRSASEFKGETSSLLSGDVYTWTTKRSSGFNVLQLLGNDTV